MLVVSRKFLIGLASFLEQAHLSLDRLPRNDLSALIDFYGGTSEYDPREVITRLEEINHGSCAVNRVYHVGHGQNLKLSAVEDIVGRDWLRSRRITPCR